VGAPSSRERILVVDEEKVRTLLSRLLVAQGYDCVTAESPTVARRTLKELPVRSCSAT